MLKYYLFWQPGRHDTPWVGGRGLWPFLLFVMMKRNSKLTDTRVKLTSFYLFYFILFYFILFYYFIILFILFYFILLFYFFEAYFYRIPWSESSSCPPKSSLVAAGPLARSELCDVGSSHEGPLPRRTHLPHPQSPQLLSGPGADFSLCLEKFVPAAVMVSV